IVGQKTLDCILLTYYKKWQFKHPDPKDFIRVAEKVSGMHLDWYKEFWINTTKFIDYGIDSIRAVDGKTLVILHRHGQMPMPLDVVVTFKDGNKKICYVPTYLMFGKKPNENPDIERTVYDAWPWTNPTYEIKIPVNKSQIKSVEIDPSQRMADINRENNKVIL